MTAGRQKLELTWAGKEHRSRLPKVVDDADPGGITQVVGWQGGG